MGEQPAIDAREGALTPPARRITPARIAWSVIGVILVLGLIGLVAKVDWSAVISALADANFALLALGLVVSLLAAAGYAVAEMGSVTVRLRFGPVLMLEYAIGFVGVVIPSTAARLALLARFMLKFGLAPGRSVTASAIASFMGLLVQATLLVLIWALPVMGFTTSPMTSGDSSDDTASSGTTIGLIGIIVLVFVVGLVLALGIPRTRRRVLARLRQGVEEMKAQAHEARVATEVLRRPRNLVQMVGGNLAAQLVQAVVLGICLLAFGESATLTQLILINTTACLLNGLAPVPGGIGVVEATLALGMMAIGIDSSVAVSIAIAFRVITFYLPPLWGAPALAWLRRRDYV